jgi:hypothetical protein
VILFRDFDLDVNSRIGIWGCHGTCNFYQIRFPATPTLEWSASNPAQAGR